MLIEGELATANNSSEILNLFTRFIFVIAETMGFVDKLFECLTTKNYLGIPAVKEPPKEEVKPPSVKSDVEVRSSAKSIGCIWILKINNLPVKKSVFKVLLWASSLTNSITLLPLKDETPEEERENRRRRSPLRNRSDFNESRYGLGFKYMFHFHLMTKHKVCADTIVIS